MLTLSKIKQLHHAHSFDSGLGDGDGAGDGDGSGSGSGWGACAGDGDTYRGVADVDRVTASVSQESEHPDV